MQRRDLLKLAVGSAAIAASPMLLDLSCQRRNFGNLIGEKPASSTPAPSSTRAIAAKVSVDWSTVLAQSTPFTFGSNDYEITTPQAAADSVYQSRLAQLGIGLIRIHYAGLFERWTNPTTKTWNEAKIKAGFDASYPQRPTIIQNLPGWPDWMAQDKDGILNPSEYNRYTLFCAQLVDILNRRQQRKIIYWEPFNEQDVAYENAGKLNELWKLYNRVARAMKAKDPQIKVGGPALTWDEPSRLESFLQACGPNVDFVSWHRYGSDDANASTDTLMSYTPKYGEQVRDFRELVKEFIPNRKVPLLLGEYNINYSWESGETRQNTHVGAVWFASVLKHLAEAGIDMATSWHLKDGVYGMIDPDNNLRPSANVFAWGIKYLTGRVMQTKSDNALVEAMAVWQGPRKRSLLLINKSAGSATLNIQVKQLAFKPTNQTTFYLDADGVRTTNGQPTVLNQGTMTLSPYSLVLLHFSA